MSLSYAKRAFGAAALRCGMALCVLVPALAHAQTTPPVYFGADLSYINEMEDCGGVYREGGAAVDPFALFAARGNNLVRVRLWHTPTWTPYSTLADVTKTIRRAKAAGMAVLLDFHYADDWADPSKQLIPAAWEGLAFDVLADSVYRYTYEVLAALKGQGLMPEMVQVGNEINPGFLLPHGSTDDWPRLGRLLNAGIRAVRAADARTQLMLHVAQPENVWPWFQAATTTGGVTDFDVIGLSYYGKWSDVPLTDLPDALRRLKMDFGKDVIVVETAYPWAPAGHDAANDILGEDALEPGYPATPEGQHDYLVALTQTILDGGGNGIVYWEPAWISTACSTRWGKGSHWENATFFDAGGEVLPGIDYMRFPYSSNQ